MQTIGRNIVTGIVTIIPLAVTAWIVWFVVDLLIWLGRPFVFAVARLIAPTFEDVAEMLTTGWFLSALALLITLVLLYLIGQIANAMIGRRVLMIFNRIVESIPFASTIHGATRTLIDSLRNSGGRNEGKRIVLLEFPTREMRAVGIVTGMFPATEEREELAAVYVPTTPNPTSGYVEIVPTRRLIWLDWTQNEAMSFIVSGGALAPKDIPWRIDPLDDSPATTEIEAPPPAPIKPEVA